MSCLLAKVVPPKDIGILGLEEGIESISKEGFGVVGVWSWSEVTGGLV